MNREHHYLQMRVPSQMAESALVGKTVGLFCRQLGLSEAESYQVELAVVEAVHNVIQHAYDSRSDCEIELHAQGLEDRLIFTLIDQGRPARLTVRDEWLAGEELELEQLPESRLGLFLIDKVMDSVEYAVHENSNILTMVRRLSGR